MRLAFLGLSLSALCGVLACSSSSSEEGSGGAGAGASSNGASGGAGNVGGASARGGASNAGGTTSSGGAGASSSGATGGVSSAGANAGGATSSAGATSSGGNASSGGAGGSASGGGGAGNHAGSGGSAGASAGGNGGAGGASDPCGASNPARVPLPTIPDRTFQVTTYGAVGDDKTDNTKALQAALDAANTAGGGTVVIPSGNFLSGPVVISSSTNLELDAGAVLKMLPMASYNSTTPLITAASGSPHDISITGSGTLDGQGQAWWDAFAADSTIARPQLMSLGRVTRVLISGIRLQNPPEEHIWVKSDTNVTITGITIDTPGTSGKNPPKNTDGIDITATGAFLCNNSITAGDDNIALNGNNIYIAYSTFGVGHGCSIGSITENGVNALTVDHVTFNGTTSGIRLKSARDRGGLVHNLTYSNITMTGVQNPVYITSFYPTLPTDPKTDATAAVTATTPEWQDITIKNVTVTGSDNAGILWGLPEAKIQNLTFDNVKISATKGMEIFHATGVSFTNGSSVTAKSGAAVTTYDATVSGITTTAD